MKKYKDAADHAKQYYIDCGWLDFWLIAVLIPFLLYICSYSYHHYCISSKHHPLQRISAWALSIPKKIPLNKYFKVLLFFLMYIPLWYYFVICSITSMAVTFLLLPVLLFAVHIVYHWLLQRIKLTSYPRYITHIGAFCLFCIFWLTLLFYSIEDDALFVITLVTLFFPYVWLPFHYYIAVKAGSAFCRLSHRGEMKIKHCVDHKEA